ncbi:MAG: MurR/RpiR family transcriptional regulator [Oscillospiraceae bacterium]|nr:MurR/RpiR family transcriptional regulator [Oscillospiraceae bacterium]
MGNILIKMAEIKDLSPSERHVVDFILEHYKDVCSMGIVELGEKTFTSTTTVKRLCRKLGVDSYTSFRMMLSAAQDSYEHQDILHGDQAPISRYDSVGDVLEKVSKQNAASILDTSHIVDSATLETVVTLMAAAKQIDFYGVGPSNVVAQDAQFKCMRLKIPSTAFCDRVSMLMQAKRSGDGTLAFLISYTGETDDIIEAAQELRRHRVDTVALTSSTDNSVARICRYTLCVDASESWDRLGGMSSRISTLNVIDALFTALLNTNYDQYIRDMVDTCVNNRRMST